MRPCHWPGCEKRVPDSMPEPFCGEHWHAMTLSDKAELRGLYRAYAEGTAEASQVRDRQAAILKTYQRKGKP